MRTKLFTCKNNTHTHKHITSLISPGLHKKGLANGAIDESGRWNFEAEKNEHFKFALWQCERFAESWGDFVSLFLWDFVVISTIWIACLKAKAADFYWDQDLVFLYIFCQKTFAKKLKNELINEVVNFENVFRNLSLHIRKCEFP